MGYVTVSAEVHTSEIVEELDSDDLRDMGLCRVDQAEWDRVAAAMRAGDLTRLEKELYDLAYKQCGTFLPVLRLDRASSQQPAAATPVEGARA